MNAMKAQARVGRMWPRRHALALLVAIVVGAWSCGSDDMVITRLIWPINDSSAEAFFRGSATENGGSPVVGATVGVDTAREGAGCAGFFGFATTTTDGNGSYAVRAVSFGAPRTICTRIWVKPPEGSGLLGDTVIVEKVHFDRFTRGDTVEVGFELRAG